MALVLKREGNDDNLIRASADGLLRIQATVQSYWVRAYAIGFVRTVLPTKFTAGSTDEVHCRKYVGEMQLYLIVLYASKSTHISHRDADHMASSFP